MRLLNDAEKQFQDYQITELHAIFERLKDVDSGLRKTINEFAKEEAQKALLYAFDKVLEPVKAEIALLVTDANKARVQLTKDAATIRKELLGNELNGNHEPQDAISMKSFYWTVACFFIGIAVGGSALYYLIK